MQKDLNIREFVNLREFAEYAKINKCHLSLKCLGKEGYFNKQKNGLTKDSPRYYKGVDIPLPVGGNFFDNKKKWHVKDVIAFKVRLDEVNEVMKNYGK